jgi:hypothetical protein
MSLDTAPGQFGVGPLARAAALIYTLLVVECLLLLTTAPTVAALWMLHRDASNLPLAAACLVPAGPALSAALYALHRRRLDLADLHPAAAFWRGYRLNARSAIAVFLPWLALLTMVAITVTHRGAAGIPRWWLVLLVVIAVVTTLWLTNALVITSLFAFRAIDVARLAAYFLLRTPMATLGNASLLLVLAVVTAVTSEVVPVLLAAAVGLGLLYNCRTMIDQVRSDFTA